MEIALFIFDKMTPLDAVGPLEVISRCRVRTLKSSARPQGR